MASTSKNRWAPVVLVILLAILLFAVRFFKNQPETERKEVAKTEQKEIRGLNRNPSRIIYSRHAQCRMECRKIDSSEVKDILTSGKINYKKSEIGDRPDCKRKYAVEGITHDQQKVRIIFAPCKNEITVVTVIDIGREWPCDCN
ncbi:MAG: DUF4258 domain-containing protein [Chitinophagaceae bacterium]|jgi:hypothetical protein|nr:DUF4258 domain-containing protein [Chitinophagaceae bacterium]